MKRVLFFLSLSYLFPVPCFAQENSPCPYIGIGTFKQITEPGETMSFSISPSEELKRFIIEYTWTISTKYKMYEPRIEAGQGTPAITISTAGLEDDEITATVEIKGLPQNCPNTFSGTRAVGKRPLARVTSDHSYLWNFDEIKARIAGFYAALNKKPASRGVIINYGTQQEINNRETEIRKAVRSGKFNIKRIEFIRADRKGRIRTQLFIVPQGEKRLFLMI